MYFNPKLFSKNKFISREEKSRKTAAPWGKR